MPHLPEKPRQVILIVDDEPAILAITQNILARRDFEVWTAGSGAEALQKVRAREHEITLLLSDVVMPGLTGPDLAERLLELNPRMRVLFMSGWDEGVIARYGGFRRNIRTILKPFSPDGLIETMETVLSEPVEVSA
jgi:two-component system, cell cycle sensor histidine kinase and response regulator CckA